MQIETKGPALEHNLERSSVIPRIVVSSATALISTIQVRLLSSLLQGRSESFEAFVFVVPSRVSEIVIESENRKRGICPLHGKVCGRKSHPSLDCGWILLKSVVLSQGQ
jgi:hypothetical protein